VGMTDRIGASAPSPEQCPPRDLRWYKSWAQSEIACLLPTCGQSLALAKLKMPDGGLAEKMLDHFRSGQSTPVEVDLDHELARNPRLKELVASRIEQDVADRIANGDSPNGSGISGAVWIEQADYGSSEAAEDQRLALGGTFFEYEVVGTADDGGLLTRLNVSDYYFWSPGECRPTDCLHECAMRMIANGEASEFQQTGEGTLTVGDPRSADPIPELWPENEEVR
jgi:hypothetical protein